MRPVLMCDRPRLIKLVENKKFKSLLKSVNQCLHELAPDERSCTELNLWNYAAALFIQRRHAPWFIENKAGKRKRGKITYPWKVKLQRKIEKLRCEISQMMSNEPNTKHLIRKIRRIKHKYKIKDDDQFQARIAEHKIEVKALAGQIRNREKKENTKTINKQFGQNPRKVYRDIMKEEILVEKPPKEEELNQFWRPLFENQKHHTESDWVETIIEENANKPHMMAFTIRPGEVKKKLKEFGNFKSPGIDAIPNFWLKKLDALHCKYESSLNKILDGTVETPEWLTRGRTSLIPKSTETQKPNKYRPITCLSTTYKLLTGLIADAIYSHLDFGNYLEEEQKGCIRKRLGTKDQLLINKTILEDAKRRQRNLSMAWIDYQKAFDSVPHSWINRCLELYNIDETLRNFLKTQMTKWETDISLSHLNGEINIPKVKIQRGIYQGDSLSPLLFCLTIDPLSKILKKQNIGYDLGQVRGGNKTKDLISHLLFMDDLKLYADSDANLNTLVQIVHKFSRDICMDFGLDKCSKCTLKKGKKVASDNLQLENGTSIEDLRADTSYKYLGIEENGSIEHKLMREKITNNYFKRMKSICKTELTSKNKIQAINQLAIPVVTYGFGIVDWPQKQINDMDVRTRKLLTLHKVTYRNQCLDRLYMPRSEGGLGLTEINQAYKSSIVALSQYLHASKDPLIKLVARQHAEKLPPNVSIITQANLFGKDIIETETDDDNRNTPATELAQNKRKIHGFIARHSRKERWIEDKRAGKIPVELDKPYIDKKESLRWLVKGKLAFNDERIIIGAQDQALFTNGFKKMAGLSDNDKCRFCHTEVESVGHLMSGCQTLMGDGHYTSRHNMVCRYIHWKVCKAIGVEVKPVQLHEPAPITPHEEYIIYYDKCIPLGRFVESGAVKPDIVIWDTKSKTAQIVEVTVPNDFGLNRAEREKNNKYQDLKNDLRNTWGLKNIELIPVVVGTTGLVKNNLQQHLKAIIGEPALEEIQLAAIKGTIRLLKRALSHQG